MIAKHWLERLFIAVERVITACLYPFCLLRERLVGQTKVPILMYHQVGRPLEEAEFCRDCVSPERFATQMRAIVAAGYKVIPLASYVRDLDEGPPEAPGRCVALTFDDGYRDQFVSAYPVLRRHRLPATLFLVAGSIGGEIPLPHLSLEDADVPERGATAGWRPLSWEQVGRMAGDGLDVGSHALSHRSLGRLSLEEAEIEVRRSREILERRLGIRIDLFAYPFGSEAYGDFDGRIQAVLRAAGYRAACTTVIGRNGRGSDRLALRRIPMEERDGPFRVRCKLAGAYDWVGTVKAFWQRRVPREDRVDVPSIDRADGERV